MAATMARQGGWVQLEQYDMRLAFNMAKTAKDGFLCAAIEETKYLIEKPRTKVREEKKRGDEFPGHKKVKAAIQRHPAMLRQNQTSSCLPCQNGTAKTLPTDWRCKGTGAPAPARRREPTPVLTTPAPCTPAAPTGDNSGAQLSEIVNLPAGYTHPHTALPCAEFFDEDEDTQQDTDFGPDMLTNEG